MRGLGLCLQLTRPPRGVSRGLRSLSFLPEDKSWDPAHTLNPGGSHLKILNSSTSTKILFPNKVTAQLPGVRMRTYIFWGHSSTYQSRCGHHEGALQPPHLPLPLSPAGTPVLIQILHYVFWGLPMGVSTRKDILLAWWPRHMSWGAGPGNICMKAEGMRGHR